MRRDSRLRGVRREDIGEVAIRDCQLCPVLSSLSSHKQHLAGVKSSQSEEDTTVPI